MWTTGELKKLQDCLSDDTLELLCTDDEIKIIGETKKRNLQLEENRKKFVEEERESLNRQRESMESNYKAKVEAVAGHTKGLEDELNRFKKAVEMQQLILNTRGTTKQMRENLTTLCTARKILLNSR